MMEYNARTVESRPGLSQEEALTSLQEHPQYKLGTKILSLRQHRDRWIAQLSEPKTADFPLEDEDDPKDEAPKGPPSDGPDEAPDDGDESPFPPKGEGDEGEGDEGDDKGKSEKGELGEILGLLHSVVEALGIAPPDGLPGPDEAFADGPPGPEGDVHQGPGRPPGPGGLPPGPKPGPEGPAKAGPLPPSAHPLTGFASVPTFTASTSDSLTIKEAKADLEQTFAGYKVKQIKRNEDGQLHALMSVR